MTFQAFLKKLSELDLYHTFLIKKVTGLTQEELWSLYSIFVKLRDSTRKLDDNEKYYGIIISCRWLQSDGTQVGKLILNSKNAKRDGDLFIAQLVQRLNLALTYLAPEIQQSIIMALQSNLFLQKKIAALDDIFTLVLMEVPMENKFIQLPEISSSATLHPTKQIKALMKAAKKTGEDIQKIEEFYQKKYNTVPLDSLDGTHKSLMDYAASSENLNLIIWLALHGVNVNTQNAGQKTPILRAMENKKMMAVILLLLLGADPSLANKKRSTAFTPPGYTIDIELQENIKFLTKLNDEKTKLMTPGCITSLDEVSTFKEHAPFLIGLIQQIAEKTNSKRLKLLYERCTLIATIMLFIEKDDLAKANLSDVIVHSSPQKKPIKLERNVQLTSYQTPVLVIEPELKAEFRKGLKPEEQIRALKEAIYYHAWLRLQLALYLFIAYYNTRISLRIEHTEGQEGKGEADIMTEACHSALVSHVAEDFRWKPGVDAKRTPYRLRSKTEEIAKPHLPEKAFLRKALSSTTVELPKAVNQYDRRLEGTTAIEGAKEGRLKLFELLDEVSLGKLDPIAALEKFVVDLIKLDGILDHIRTSGYLSESTETSPQVVRPIIHRYVFFANLQTLNREKEGAFHLKPDYVASMLFMNKEDRTLLKSSAPIERNALCEPYYKKLQDEIRIHVI